MKAQLIAATLLEGPVGATQEQLDDIMSIVQSAADQARKDPDRFERIVNDALDLHGYPIKFSRDPVELPHGAPANVDLRGMFIKTPPSFDDFNLKRLRHIISHECVHVYQIDAADRTGDADKMVSSAHSRMIKNGRIDHGRYMTDKHEVMAHARSFIDNYRANGYPRGKVTNDLRRYPQGVAHGAEQNRFRKLAYQYAQDLPESAESDPDDVQSFLKRHLPKWGPLTCVPGYRRYFISDDGQIAVGDNSMKQALSPETCDDGLLLLDKNRPITIRSGQYDVPLIQFARADLDRPMRASMRMSKKEFDRLWPHLELRGFTRPPEDPEEVEESLQKDVAQAAQDAERHPTDGQKEAGNYAKGHVVIQGLDISIENAKGSVRRGTDKGGKEWSVRMPAHYGYIKGTKGKDKDHIDVYIGPDPECETVYVVDQINLDTDKFDEHKCMIGYTTIEQAKESYDNAFSDSKGPDRRKSITGMSMKDFKEWIASGDTTKPVAKQVNESTDPDNIDFEGYVQNLPGDWIIVYNKNQFYSGFRKNTYWWTCVADHAVKYPSAQAAKTAAASVRTPADKVGHGLKVLQRTQVTENIQTDPDDIDPREYVNSLRQQRPKIDAFTRGYIEAALWSSDDEAGNSLDRYSASDIDPETLWQMYGDCQDFKREHADLLAHTYSDRNDGQDFWLSRNGHGAGFFDRDNLDEEVRDALQAAAHSFGGFNLEVIQNDEGENEIVGM